MERDPPHVFIDAFTCRIRQTETESHENKGLTPLEEKRRLAVAFRTEGRRRWASNM